MNKLLTTTLLTAFSGIMGFSQVKEGVTHSGQPTHQPPFPLETYKELPNPASTDTAEWTKAPVLTWGWGTADTRYKKEVPVQKSQLSRSIRLTGWKGERVSAQWVVSSRESLPGLTVSISAGKGKKGTIAGERLHSGFVRYVMTDGLNPDGGGCGHRPDLSKFDSTLVADPIDHLTKELDVKEFTTQSGWIGIDIPQDISAGRYTIPVELKSKNETIGTLKLEVDVKEHTLPSPEQWAFHLDLWQNPYAIARYHKVPLWSKEHFDIMRPYMEMYRDAGGKVITASIMNKPWNGQTYDFFRPMVTWMKKSDGSWFFDYTPFDQWIEFMQGIGGFKQINCYSMIPWDLSFQYYDQASNSLQYIKTKPGDKEYRDLWTAMLKSFANHLKEKGWFDITYIAMDERPMKDMQEAISIIREADPKFKIALAGILHPELLDSLDDYCIPLRLKFTPEMKNKREKEGKTTTYYTCCEESYPNTFTFSPAAEAEWLGWYAAKEKLDGYLRWALNSWVIEPLLDSRFYTWAAGDTYIIYPGARSSIRFERLRDGIEAYEKVRILRRELENAGNKTTLKQLDKVLRQFDETKLVKEPAAKAVKRANDFINKL